VWNPSNNRKGKVPEDVWNILRARPLPEAPQDVWKRRAVAEAPLLAHADWVKCIAFRTTDLEAPNETAQAFLERIFKFGFRPNNTPVTVGWGVSTGGVASAKEWDGASRYADCIGKYVCLVAAEGFYLPSCDGQNRSHEIMSHSIPGCHVLAGARLDAVDEQCGYVLSRETSSVCFNHRFRRPPWVSTGMLEEGLRCFIDGLGGHTPVSDYSDLKDQNPEQFKAKRGLRRFDEDEYAAICRYLSIAPAKLP
jgi:hypothetical protein